MQKFTLKLIVLLFPALLSAQGYLHTEGKYIYDGNGQEVILRGIGTGNWMLQEGYMMKTSGVANTQHEFRARLIETIGEAKTDSFYSVWLQNHMTRTDVDSMKAWGFNSIRVAMHYLWFTPPIEEEPVPGEITWIETGFTMIDSLLKWCSDNEMYLILDMHGTPGGQGKDAAISDYDPDKPSLWESQDNKDKLVALWQKLAERYSDEPWIGGYDMINEPNWTFTEANNKPLWDLYKDITAAIREVDTNHIIILEGNWFANDYSGLPTLWDENLVLSFHKYWTYNDENSLNWMINLQNQRNVPLWLGETGENSNTWFTNLIALAEKNHIGWSWWPVKKDGINNVLNVNANSDYLNLIRYWEGSATKPSEDVAFAAVLKWADNHKIENCFIQYDVIDAMIRQPNSYESMPFKPHTTQNTIFAADYDLGRYNVAYSDSDSANYHSSEDGKYTNWNQGWSYRNDGVDIEACNDTETNGYNVGWTSAGEWLLFTVNADSLAAYTLEIRYASGGSGGTVRIEVDGIPVSPGIVLAGTGGWQNWQTKQVNGIIFPEGSHKLKIHFVNGGINLNYLKFTNPISANVVDFIAVDAQTSNGTDILLTLNKDVTSDISKISLSGFSISAGGNDIEVENIALSDENNRVLVISLVSPVYYGEAVTLSFSGTDILTDDSSLQWFSDLSVRNLLPVRYNIPGKIQAENFSVNNGLQLETCDDTGGGQNTGYANPGDYLDYLVKCNETKLYAINYRVATTNSNAKLILQHNQSGTFVSVDTITFTSTGNWQTWQTQTSAAELPEGRYNLRLLVLQGEHNLNWFEVATIPPVTLIQKYGNVEMHLYPNPAYSVLNIELPSNTSEKYLCTIHDVSGKIIARKTFNGGEHIALDIENLDSGMYFVKITSDNKQVAFSSFMKN
ncbi:MAG: carbohydrate-binding protein [Bacteroidales bacterium]|nr:carbohydrate-binding protein [Bacteroidales bacterium]